VGVPERAPYPVINPALYQNPYWEVYRKEHNEHRDRLTGFMQARYDITDWLHVTARANMDKVSDKRQFIRYQGHSGTAPTSGGSYGEYFITNEQKWFDAMLEGSNSLTKDFKIDYRVGGIVQDRRYTAVYDDANGLNVTNFFSLNFATNRAIFQDASQTRVHSLFGQINLAFKEFLFLDASLRNDWDSRLPSPYTILYPSVGVSAIISELTTLPTAVSFLKLSGNYAVVGNGGQAQIRFNTFGYELGAGHGYISRSITRAIPDLKIGC
jgi:hypothetical protein